MNNLELRAQQWLSAHTAHLGRPSVAYNSIRSSLTSLLESVARDAIEFERMRIIRAAVETMRRREEES